eukprot:3860671-Amphidinium_carterae.1
MTALQTLTVFKQLGINWIVPFDWILRQFSLVSFNLDVVRMGCFAGSAPVYGYLQRQCVAPLGLSLLLLQLQVKKRLLPATNLQNEIINTTGTLLNILFISIVVSALAPHVCYEHPGDSGSSVVFEPSILCNYSRDHMSVVIIGLFAWLLVPMPFLALVLYAVLRYPIVVKRSVARDNFLAAFRFLFV